MKNLLLAAALMATATGMHAQKEMAAPAGGKAISDELVGIFFEDINFAADGGLYADLVQNGSFEYSPTERDGWGPGTCWRFVRPGHSLGRLIPMQADPVHRNNPNYMHLVIERAREYYDYNGWIGIGIENDGYNGITLKAGAKYDFSAIMRNTDARNKQVRVSLLEPAKDPKEAPKILADTIISVVDNDWTKYECTLTAADDCKNAKLSILVLTVGEMDIDNIELMPQDTFKGHGLRRDLAETLAALQPKFLRFPGGAAYRPRRSRSRRQTATAW